MKGLLSKKVPLMIGLDIGTRFIKAVVIEKKKDEYTVHSAVCEPIHKEAFAEREIKDFEAVSLALRKVQKSLRTKLKDVVIGVSGSSVISKIVYMNPGQTDFELESQIEIEADSLIPYPLEEVYLDFEELGPSNTHVGKVNILLSAAHKDIVDSRLTLVREIPFEPRVVDVEGYALGNAISHFYDKSYSGQICCINLGASALQVSVVKDNEVLYSKEHNFGMNMLLQDISMMHMMEKQDVEKGLIDGSLSDSWKTDTLPIFLANCQQQINRAIQMYTTTTHSPPPEKMLLTGGGACIPELVSALDKELDMEVSAFNPFKNIAIGKNINTELVNSLAPQFCIAAGLATRSFSPWHM
ncbi:type IV pilus assembly protein PilM [Alteromonas sp. 5E99-2]|uniref:type IV pilus biogenesis protein PilM n=1 Tax=Alteromonas sp. 5E99-2 TaxID=2817683 RepID=UPI001A9A2ADE|nr:type IV pilus assembly protein PilM [Alteromonas sp. 5E99-2]MBO1254632.1 type IV pilus assembly protein PilM [Alteromonas sp. 5E99-2]